MIYKFRSQAAGDVIMLGPHGDHLLGLIGRQPSAQGIIDTEQMPAVIGTLKAAVAAEDAAQPAPDADGDAQAPADPVSLRQRLWPMVQLLEQSLAAGKPVVWGV